MYWRFRNITRNRIRVQSWLRRRQNGRQPPQMYRPRGAAAFVYRGASRRSWIALLALVVGLTALTAAARQVFIYPSLVYALGSLIVVGCIYWALRGL
jgi:hypothetical protein